MKTGYHSARQIKRENDIHCESSLFMGSSSVLARLWKLHIPNKVKVFAWRACHDILPTRKNLARTLLINDGTCELCKRATEFAIHALWECSMAQDVWVRCARRLQKGVGGQLDLLQLAEELLKNYLFSSLVVLESTEHYYPRGEHARPDSADQESYRFFRRVQRSPETLVYPDVSC